MGCPQVKSRSALREKLVALVDSRNARDRAGLVIKDLVCNVRRNAQPSHPRHAGPA